MQIESKKINDVSIEATANIPKDTIEQKENDVAKKYAKEVKLDGFRKGKVPVNLVKKKFAADVEQEAQNALLQNMLNDILKEHALAMSALVGEPSITKFDKNDKGLDVELTIYTKPVVNIEGYKEVIPTYEAVEADESELKEQVAAMIKAVAPLNSIEEDRAIENGDFSVIDFEGFVDGVAFEGGKAAGYSLEIGSGTFIPGFEEGIVGMKKGESKEIEVTFPESYQNKELAGKPSTFKVTLTDIQQREAVAELTDEMAKQLSPGQEDITAEKLIDNVKTRLNSDKMQQLYADELKPKLIDALVAKFDFDLPQNIVDQEINISINNALRGKSEEEVKAIAEDEAKINEMKEEFTEGARKSVKLTFIVDELAKAEEVSVSDEEVAQTLYYEAIQMGQPPKEVMEYYQQQGLLPAVKMSMIEDRLFTKLLDIK
jgi:trigger factor